MTAAQAQAAAARLFAAWPSQWARTVDKEATNAVYCAAFQELRTVPQLDEAIATLIRTEEYLPSIARVLDEYRRLRDRHAPPALPEPELTPQERAANIERMRRLAKAVEEGVGFDRVLDDGT
jgi:hypothetical protein